MRNHWDDEWTLRIENRPLRIQITMRDAHDQAQTKNMGATTKNTKRTMEVGTQDATEVNVKKVEEVDTTTKTAELHSTPNDENHSAGNQTGKEKKPTNPTKTLRETLERQRKTAALIINKPRAKDKRNNRKTYRKWAPEPTPRPHPHSSYQCSTAEKIKPRRSPPGKEEPGPARATPSDTDFSYPRTLNLETSYCQ